MQVKKNSHHQAYNSQWAILVKHQQDKILPHSLKSLWSGGRVGGGNILSGLDFSNYKG